MSIKMETFVGIKGLTINAALWRCVILCTIIYAIDQSCEALSFDMYSSNLVMAHRHRNEKNQMDGRIQKRSATSSTSVCPPTRAISPAQTSSTHEFDVSNDLSTSHNTITMMWTGTDNATRVIGLSHDRGAVASNVYFSKLQDGPSVAYTFAPSNGLDNITVSVMATNPSDHTHVLVLGRSNLTYKACVSKDSGASFECNNMIEGYAPASSTLLFKDHKVMTIMRKLEFYSDDLLLMLSTDYGATWLTVHHEVISALFQPDNGNYLLALISVADSNPFAGFGFSMFGGVKKTQLKKIDVSKIDSGTAEASDLPGLNKTGVTGFQYTGGFLHVVALDDDGHKILKVSKDNGKTFSDTHLPTTASGQYINILDSSDQLIFAHVTDAKDPTIGKLFTSGYNGVFYTESLDGHVGDDFYNVLSMSGVYLTTQKQGDDSLMTRISLDRGAEWKPITVRGCTKDECTLQIYSKYLIGLHAKSNSEALAQPPYSSENAIGMIVVQGVIASKILYNTVSQAYDYEKENVGVFISGDGGYTWTMAPEEKLKGPHHLLIEDSGGIIQALPMHGKADMILFSVDEGSCWYNLPVSTEKLPVDFNIKGLITQPGQQSLKLGIVGHGKTANDQTQWFIVDVDFKPAVNRPCNDSVDYADWDDHAGCYLGAKRTYRRVKTNSWCYRGPQAKNTYDETLCQCLRADYECDYGFRILDNANKDCVKDPTFKDDDVTYCLDNKVYKLTSSGYRKVPGDKCEGSGPKSIGSVTPRSIMTNRSCDDEDASTYLDIDIVRSKICESSSPQATTDNKSNSSGLVAATVILTLLSTVLCVALTTVYCKYKRLQRHYDFGTFDNCSWEVNPAHDSSGSSSSSRSEAAKIMDAGNTGRSYTKLKESGVESDVDLLNL